MAATDRARDEQLVEGVRARAALALSDDGGARVHHLDGVAAAVSQFLGGDTVSVTLTTDGEWIETFGAHNPDPAVEAAFREAIGARVRVGDGYTTRVAVTGVPVFVPEPDEIGLHDKLLPRFRAFVDVFPLRSLMTVAIRRDGRPIGALHALRAAPAAPYTAADLEALQRMADEIGAALATSDGVRDLAPSPPDPAAASTLRSGSRLFPVRGRWQLAIGALVPLALTLALSLIDEPTQYRPSAILVGGVVLVGALAGRRATVVAAVTSFLCLWYVVYPPSLSFALENETDIWGLATLAVCSVVILWMVVRIESAGNRLLAAEREEAAARSQVMAAELQARDAQSIADGRFRSLVEATTSLVWVADGRGSFATPQFAWESYTGQQWSEQAGTGWHAMIHEADRDEFLAGWNDALSSGVPFEHRGRLWHDVSQMWRWFETRAVPLRDASGAISEWIGAVADVHAEVEAILDAERVGRALQSTLEERDRVARTLQASLLPPELPRIAGLTLSARYLAAASGGGIGGDFYDVYPSGEGDWDIVMGDVCGKGADAAALTALARHSLRAAAIEHDDPGQILSLLNEAILRSESEGRFVTAAYGQLDASISKLRIALAGHHQPRLVRGGDVVRIGTHGPLVGVLSSVTFPITEVDLRPGDQIIWFTDGLIEQPNGRFVEDDLDPFLRTLGRAGRGADAVAEALAERAGADDEREDDVAILVVEVGSVRAAGDGADAAAPPSAPDDAPGSG
jgi:serine phosphatase RsbU (regulator of sigma subunit)/PAS domain-containing protein